MTDYIDCWHFAANTLRDGSPLPDAGVELPALWGSTPCHLEIEGDFSSGMYHGSVRAIDALGYAPGIMVARVRIWDTVIRLDDKVAGCRRMNLTSYVDAAGVLQECARLYARQVLHHWGGSVPGVVLECLYTGDIDLAAAAAVAAGEAKAVAKAEATEAAAEAAAVAAVAAAVAKAEAAEAAAAAATAAVAWAESAWAESAWEVARSRQNIALELRLGELLGVVV